MFYCSTKSAYEIDPKLLSLNAWLQMDPKLESADTIPDNTAVIDFYEKVQ